MSTEAGLTELNQHLSSPPAVLDNWAHDNGLVVISGLTTPEDMPYEGHFGLMLTLEEQAALVLKLNRQRMALRRAFRRYFTDTNSIPIQEIPRSVAMEHAFTGWADAPEAALVALLDIRAFRTNLSRAV